MQSFEGCGYFGNGMENAMKLKEKISGPVASIGGGVFLPHLKASAEAETVIMPPPDTVYIPLSQHIGKPAVPTVNSGDKVYVGTLIAKADGFVSAPVHSSVSGTVKEIAESNVGGQCIVVESDGQCIPDPDLSPFKVETAEDIAEAADRCGLVGLGGAGFPSRVKLSAIKNSSVDTLVVNAAECEPYITSDYRECIEHTDDIINGICLLMQKLGIKSAVICVESNKKSAIRALCEAVKNKGETAASVKVMQLPSKYPQGAEKVIVYSATGRRVPLGKLPTDVGCMVMNVTSIAVLYRFITTGMPLVSRRITVDGTAVSKPKNIIVPLGTKIKALLEFVGGISDDADEIIMGGPMMGADAYSAYVVAEKRTNAVLVMKPERKEPTVTACIRCGRCAGACPMRLYPSAVEAAVKRGEKAKLSRLNVNYCMECGSCSFVCPAKRPLAQAMRLAKSELKG